MFEDIDRLKHRPDQRHFMATVVGLNRGQKTIVTDEYSVIEVVDGQQRLTTLIVLLKAIQLALADHSKLAAELQGILIKQDELSLILLQMNHDPNGYFAEYLRHGKSSDPSVAKTIADRALLTAIKDCTKFVTGWGDLIQLTGIVKNRLTFIFHEIDDEATVYTVFEVLNSRGLAVPWLDRLKSLLMGIAFEHGSGNKAETIAELHGIWEGIYTTIGLRQGLSTEALRFAATLKSSNQRSKALGEEEAVESLVKQCGTDPAKTIATSRWVLRVAQGVEEFLAVAHRSRAVTRIAHARLLAVAIGLTKFSDAEKATLYATWEKISFRVFGLCHKDARTQVGEYVRLAWDCVNTDITAADRRSTTPENRQRRPRTRHRLGRREHQENELLRGLGRRTALPHVPLRRRARARQHHERAMGADLGAIGSALDRAHPATIQQRQVRPLPRQPHAAHARAQLDTERESPGDEDHGVPSHRPALRHRSRADHRNRRMGRSTSREARTTTARMGTQDMGMRLIDGANQSVV